MTIPTRVFYTFSTLVTLTSCRAIQQTARPAEPSAPVLFVRSYRVPVTELRSATKRALLLQGFVVRSDDATSIVRGEVEAHGRYADGGLVIDSMRCDQRPPQLGAKISLTAIIDSTQHGSSLQVYRTVASTDDPSPNCAFVASFVDELLARIGRFAVGERP